MKQFVLAMAAAILVFAGCSKTKTIRVADFTATYPSTLEVMSSSDEFPNSASLFFQGENGQIGMNTVVYYADEELEFLDAKYEENGGLHGFIYVKMMELFEKVDNGMIIRDIDIEDVSDLEWTNDDLCGSFLFSGKRGEEEAPFIGGITIYFNKGALVTCLALGSTAEEIEELLEVGTSFEFDAHDEGYQPEEDRIDVD